MRPRGSPGTDAPSIPSLAAAIAGLACLAIVPAACGNGPAEDPCDEIVCAAPPDPRCVGTRAVVHQPGGECIAGQCVYEEIWTDCQAQERACEAGACVDIPVDPCANVICDQPPAPACEGDEAVVWVAGLGTCDGETGDCVYTEESRTDCTLEGRYCEDGACVEADPCANESCLTPPSTRCRDGNLEIFEDEGTCFAGLCTYYVAEREFCADQSLACDAENEECVDLCSGQTCDEPPEASCDGYTRVRWSETGECDFETGACVYEELRLNCALTQHVCDAETADCVDPCAGVVCEDEPDAYCDDDDVAIHFVGSCAWYEGGDCEYTEVPTNCAQDGRTCLDGACVD
jgi:hypothetical protein